jgi:alkylhydroperoxidase family enzyme
MSYIETPANFHFTWYVRLLFWIQRRHYGRELEPARLWGRTPRAFLPMAAMYGALNRKASPLAPALRAQVQVRVSQINSEPALIARLRQHFSDDAIIELTALIAYQNLSSKFNAALDVPAQGFCVART